jgi:hypothetical protein
LKLAKYPIGRILTESQGAAGKFIPTKELLDKLKEFREKIKEHQELWGSSLDRRIPALSH